jgi:hypothetical protein
MSDHLDNPVWHALVGPHARYLLTNDVVTDWGGGGGFHYSMVQVIGPS